MFRFVCSRSLTVSFFAAALFASACSELQLLDGEAEIEGQSGGQVGVQLEQQDLAASTDLTPVLEEEKPVQKRDSIFASMPSPLPLAALNPSPILREARGARNARAIVPSPVLIEGSQEALRAQAGDRICFSASQKDLDERSQETLSQVADWLAQNPRRSLIVQGHTVPRRTRDYAVGLAEHRADLVVRFLSDTGVDPKRLSKHAFGRERANLLCKAEMSVVYLIAVRTVRTSR